MRNRNNSRTRIYSAYEYLCAIALRSLYARTRTRTLYSLRNCKYEFLIFRPNPMFPSNMGLGRNIKNYTASRAHNAHILIAALLITITETKRIIIIIYKAGII